MYRLLDLPRLRPHKRSAKSARSAREQAFGETLARIKALIAAEEDACWVHHRLNEAADADTAARLGQAMAAARATIERFRHSSSEFREELERRRRSAKAAAGYDALADFELARRDALVAIGEEARSQLAPLRALANEGRDQLLKGKIYVPRKIPRR